MAAGVYVTANDGATAVQEQHVQGSLWAATSKQAASFHHASVLDLGILGRQGRKHLKEDKRGDMEHAISHGAMPKAIV
eukprot:1150652-Pelagomonas_calceolata.AAC.1